MQFRTAPRWKGAMVHRVSLHAKAEHSLKGSRRQRKGTLIQGEGVSLSYWDNCMWRRGHNSGCQRCGPSQFLVTTGLGKALQNETREMKLSGLGRERGDVFGSCLGGKMHPCLDDKGGWAAKCPKNMALSFRDCLDGHQAGIQEKGQCPCTRVSGEILLTQTGKRSDFWTAG